MRGPNCQKTWKQIGSNHILEGQKKFFHKIFLKQKLERVSVFVLKFEGFSDTLVIVRTFPTGGSEMKKGLVFAVVFVAIVVYTKTRSDFPNLSRFQVSDSCKDEYSSVKSGKVRVNIYLLDKNESAPRNEAITIITLVDSQKQFAARHIFEDVDLRNPERAKESRRIYVKSWRGWQEVIDGNAFIDDVVGGAPKEYLLNYSPYRDTKPSEPANNEEKYRNLLKNAGCSLHGPIG